ncbi:MAG: hypothetical protein IT342_20015 [Candidatus Melainabacteria bacterium]|nr:hypothetical protein [Candidatus Melainabacteria bacterium]
MSTSSPMLGSDGEHSHEKQMPERANQSGLSAGDVFSGISKDDQKTILAAMQPQGDLGQIGFKDVQLFDTAAQNEALFKSVDTDKDGFMSKEELANAAKDAKNSQTERGLAQALLQQTGEIQNFFDDPGFDSKGISRADLSTPEGQKMLAWLKQPDVQKMHAVLETSIKEMVAGGERKEGGGPIDRWYNNLSSKLGDDKILECYGQAERVLQNIDKAGLGHKWDMHLVGDLSATGTAAMAMGGESPGHFRVELLPRQKGDPIVIIDPWKNQIELKDPATYKPSESYFNWTNKDGNTMYGNVEEQFRLLERPKVFKQWQEQGKPEGNFNTWLQKTNPELAKALDPNNRGKLPRDYGLSDYWKQKFQ